MDEARQEGGGGLGQLRQLCTFSQLAVVRLGAPWVLGLPVGLPHRPALLWACPAFCTSGFWSVIRARQHPCQRAVQACTEQRLESGGIFRRKERKPERSAVDAGGLGWVCRGHVGQGGGQGRRRLWGARLPMEFTPELSACTGLPGGGSEAQMELPAGSRRGPGGDGRAAPRGAPTPHREVQLPSPGTPPPPQAHRLPRPPLVTLAADIHKSH